MSLRIARPWILTVLLFSAAGHACANDSMRDWKTADGETRRAELVSYDESGKVVVLRREDDSEIRVKHDDLSALDRAWVLEWTEFAEELQAKLDAMGGTLTKHEGTGRFTTEYSVYQPPLGESDSAAKPPMLILFHPNGDGHRAILKYFEAAKATGMTLVSCDYFRNTGNDSAREAEMLERFTELLPEIEAAVPHDADRMFMGGCSGGSWRAFHYSAQIKRPWAGIYSNCGWLGGKIWYHLPYPKMRVALVNGNKDPAGTYHMERDTVRLHEAGCVVSVHAFEGGHQVPPPSVQEKAFRWLLGAE